MDLKTLAVLATLSPAVSASAHAQEPPTPATAAPAPMTPPPVLMTPPTPVLAPTPALTPAMKSPPALMRVPWTDPTGRGIAIGYDLGLWGHGSGDSFRLRVPFARQHWVLVGRFLGVIGQKGTDGMDRAVEYGGSLELHGQSDVYLNLMRLYGGGGVEMIHGHRGPDRGRTAWTGRYEFGFEFFLAPRMSFTLEIGGNGMGTALTEGPMIFGGINLYTILLR